MSHEESNIQIACIKYFRLQYPEYLCFSVPNGGIRTQKNARILKAEGLLAGVADLIIVLPNKVLFIEIKTEKGRQQQTQKDFQNKVEALEHDYYVCRSFDEFVQTVEQKIKKNKRR